MRSSAPDGLTKNDRQIIYDVLKAYPDVCRAVLFGSRAMGSFSRGSDIDLALEGANLNQAQLSRIAGELDESRLPFNVDLLLISNTLHPPLLEHISQEGQLFYEQSSKNG